MFIRWLLFISLLLSACGPQPESMSADTDPYIWLEDVDAERSLNWVKAQNKVTDDYFKAKPEFAAMEAEALDILNATDRFAYPSIKGDMVYNFWQDGDHPRGIYRRMTLTDYLAGKSDWNTVLDLDAMSKKDGVKYVYKGASFMPKTYDRALVRLSKGGGDAVIIREYDMGDDPKPLEGGFELPEAKGSMGYIDANTVFVQTDFGPGSQTTSGYARITKMWKRGTSLSDATTIFEGDTTDVSVSAYVMRDGNDMIKMVYRGVTFYSREYYYLNDDNKPVKLDLPSDASIYSFFKGQVVINLKSDLTVDGKTFKSGSLISASKEDFLSNKKKYILLYEPEDRSSMVSLRRVKDYLILNTLENVIGKLAIIEWNNGKWESTPVQFDQIGNVGIGPSSEDHNFYMFYFANFVTPTTYYRAEKTKYTKFKAMPARFDGSKYSVTQKEATSKDGTKIPYFLVMSKEAKMDGSNPTLLYAYGGFNISMRPGYSATVGKLWLDRGGVYVLANIRGGGEFGPEWHKAGLKENRQRVYDDFHAVAEHLISTKVTSAKHLGIRGGSNGGLLVGVAYTQRPDLYSAVHCAVPLLDMKRYNKLLAGASWMGEYGNPDKPEEWAYISKYSPYQNLKNDADYPKVLFTTSTRDDRVHPGHARKMAARMKEYNHPFFYYENIEGGHGGSSTNAQRAYVNALVYSYMLDQLKGM